MQVLMYLLEKVSVAKIGILTSGHVSATRSRCINWRILTVWLDKTPDYCNHTN